jgi:DNA-binding CsgD family transcriptional regulator
MWRHLFILIIFCNLVVGICAILHLHYLWKMHHYNFLKYLELYTLLLNLVIFQLLISYYWNVNFPAPQNRFNLPLLEEIWTFITTLFISGMIFSLVLVCRDFLGKPQPRHFFQWFLGWGGMVSLCFIGKHFLAAGFFKQASVFMVDEVLDSIILLEGVIIIALLVASRKIQAPAMRRLVKAFGYLYLSRYGGWFLLFALMGIPRVTWMFLSAAVFLYTNFVPFLWTRFYFTKYLGYGLKARDNREKLAAVMEKFALSKRELEILELILEGLNNKEIDAQLFISYHTVKNHVTSIYRKLKVKNRYQLIHLLTKRTD